MRPAATACALALEAGLVDELLPRDARLDRLQSRFGADPEDPLAFQAIGLRAYLANRPEAPKPDAPAVAVIVAEGTIAPGPGGDGEVGDDVVAQIHDARLDETVAAVVLRVNSPGGAANQSEQVRRALALVQSHGKPVVVSMGDVAASEATGFQAPRIISSLRRAPSPVPLVPLL